MGLAEKFRGAVARAYDTTTACAELVPMVLARACVEVLPVDGAGLSITSRLRLPLGSSDAPAARVERLQTTLGEGPCLAATATNQPVAVGLDTITAQWPMFAAEMVAQSPFRSVVALPLLSHSHGLLSGALDLFLDAPDPTGEFPDWFLTEISSQVAQPIAGVLFDTSTPMRLGSGCLPPWLDHWSVTDRMHVWVAVGILTEHAGLGESNALAALRAYAFSHDTTLDDLAHELMTKRLAPQSVLA